MNGFINLYKPSGVSSAYVLNGLKKILKGETMGHMGTLDPLAYGVLPVAIGKSTRLFDYLLDKKKEYIADVAFGYETDTLDLEGKVVKTSDKIPSFSEVNIAIKGLIGEIMQIPPVFSAKCVNGKRSYALARKGKTVDLPPKKVNIYDIEIIEYKANECKIKIVCGGGTYIRAIARDLGELCSSCATMTALERSASGIFHIDNSVTLEELSKAENIGDYIIPPQDAVDFPILNLSENEAIRLYNGLYDDFDKPNGTYKVFEPDGFYGVGEITDGKLKVKAYIRDDKNI